MLKKENYSKAYEEVYEILKYVDKEYTEKIPKEFMNLIKQKKDNSYNYVIDETKDFQQQEMLRETMAILAYIYINYWSTPKEKAKIESEFRAELQRENEEKKKKYSDDIFKVNNDKKSVENKIGNIDDNSIMEYTDENVIKKIWNKIKKLFK